MNKHVWLLYLLFTISCGTPSGNVDEAKLDRQERIKLKQYLNEGKKLYKTHCANCHQQDGSGLARLYPPLKNSDYLNGGVDRIICQIRYGADGEMVVNGVKFNMPMPEKPELTPLEIAEISTYIFNEWGNHKGLISTEKVAETLRTCEAIP